MSANLNDPAPHAQAWTSFGSLPITFPARSSGLWVTTTAAGSIGLIMADGSTVVFALGAVTSYLLPVQASGIASQTSVSSVVVLWQ